MRNRVKFFHIATCALSLLAFGACARIQTPSNVPSVRPATRERLAAAMNEMFPETRFFYARMELTPSRRFPPSKGRTMVLQSNYFSPDRIVVQVGQQALVGGLFRIVQSGDQAAILLIKEGEHYRGTIDELNSRPDLFFGLEPLDLVRVVAAGCDAARILQSPSGDSQLRHPSFFRKDWILVSDSNGASQIEYRIRPKDGLVSEARILDAKGRWRVRAEYRAYERFGGTLFSTRFDLYFRGWNARARVVVQSLDRDREMKDSYFSLEPPLGIEGGTFQYWLKNLAPAR